MKFNIESRDLKSVMGRMAAICESRVTIPVLQNVLIEATEYSITFKATDLDIMIKETVSQKPDATGAITVPAFTLRDIAAKIDDGALVYIELKDNIVHVKAGKSKFKLNTLPASDFPVLASDQFQSALSFQGEHLKRAIERTGWAASKEETRYYLKGIALQSEEGKATLITTDGHRLARFITEVDSDAPNVIVPSKTAAQFASVLTDGEATLLVSETKVKLVCGGVEILSKVIDGSFPAWQRVIPPVTSQNVTVASQDLAKAVERVQVVMNERSKIVKMTVAEGELTLTAPQREGSGEATDTIEAVRNGVDADIGVSAKYALDAMRQADKGSVCIQYGTGGDPLLITYDKEPELLVVVMPARI